MLVYTDECARDRIFGIKSKSWILQILQHETPKGEIANFDVRIWFSDMFIIYFWSSSPKFTMAYYAHTWRNVAKREKARGKRQTAKRQMCRAFELKPKVNWLRVTVGYTSSNIIDDDTPSFDWRVSPLFEGKGTICTLAFGTLKAVEKNFARLAKAQEGRGRLTHRHVCWPRCWWWNRVSWGWTASWCWRDSSSVWTMVPEAERSWPVPGPSRGTAGAEPPIDPPPRRDAWWHLANSSASCQLVSSRSALTSRLLGPLSSLENEMSLLSPSSLFLE